MKMDEMVNRFLTWPLPKSVCADGCATDPSYPHQRTGTNLLTADEARAMLRYVLGPDEEWYRRRIEEAGDDAPAVLGAGLAEGAAPLGGPRWPADYESCPKCHGSFSFHKPRNPTKGCPHDGCGYHPDSPTKGTAP